jgi:hypothetical protein
MCQFANAQVDSVKRSDLSDYTLGKGIGKGLKHGHDFKAHLRERDEEYDKLNALKQQVAKNAAIAQTRVT